MFDPCGATDIDYESKPKAVTADDLLKKKALLGLQMNVVFMTLFSKTHSNLKKTADNNKVDSTA